jgi:transposase
MPDAHPIELRRRVVDAYERGDGSYATVAERFRVGEASVKRWVWQLRREGHIAPRPKGGGNRSDISLGEIDQILTALGDANAAEIAKQYNRGRRGDARRHVSSIKRALHRAGYVVKKKGSARSNNSGPT